MATGPVREVRKVTLCICFAPAVLLPPLTGRRRETCSRIVGWSSQSPRRLELFARVTGEAETECEAQGHYHFLRKLVGPHPTQQTASARMRAMACPDVPFWRHTPPHPCWNECMLEHTRERARQLSVFIDPFVPCSREHTRAYVPVCSSIRPRRARTAGATGTILVDFAVHPASTCTDSMPAERFSGGHPSRGPPS